eukprot:2447798-Pyramimonas_sp.AAC.1
MAIRVRPAPAGGAFPPGRFPWPFPLAAPDPRLLPPSPRQVVLFSKTYCSFSAKVKSVLAELNVTDVHSVELNLLPQDVGLAMQLELSVLTNNDAVPQVRPLHPLHTPSTPPLHGVVL